jgi:hypothetical protein
MELLVRFRRTFLVVGVFIFSLQVQRRTYLARRNLPPLTALSNLPPLLWNRRPRRPKVIRESRNLFFPLQGLALGLRDDEIGWVPLLVAVRARRAPGQRAVGSGQWAVGMRSASHKVR